MLINRAWIAAGDYSGTLGVRRSAMLRVGHYDGDGFLITKKSFDIFACNFASRGVLAS